MFWRSSFLPSVLAVFGLLLTPAPALGENVFSPPGRSASAALDFRIIIPALLRVLENTHPHQLPSDSDSMLTAQQRLVVVSNMQHGFCVVLRVDTSRVSGWRLQVVPQAGISLTAVADGYRLCSARPGRYSLLLQHEFDLTGRSGPSALDWPVQADLMTL